MLNLSTLSTHKQKLKSLDAEVENYANVLFKKSNLLKNIQDRKLENENDGEVENLKAQLENINYSNISEKLLYNTQVQKSNKVIESSMNQLMDNSKI